MANLKPESAFTFSSDVVNPFDDYVASTPEETQAAKPTERTWGQAAKDTLTSFGSGAGDLTKTVGTTLFGSDSAMAEAGGEASQYWDAKKSDILKSKEQQLGQLINSGEILAATKYVASNPELSSSMLASSLPGMAAGMGIGGVVAKTLQAGGVLVNATGGLTRIGTGLASGVGEGSVIAADVYTNTDGSAGAATLAGVALGVGTALIPGNVTTSAVRKMTGSSAAEGTGILARDTIAGVAARTGASIGGEMGQELVQETGQSAIEQYTNTGDVDWEKASAQGAVGAVVGGITGGAMHFAAGEGSKKAQFEQAQANLAAMEANHATPQHELNAARAITNKLAVEADIAASGGRANEQQLMALESARADVNAANNPNNRELAEAAETVKAKMINKIAESPQAVREAADTAAQVSQGAIASAANIDDALGALGAAEQSSSTLRTTTHAVDQVEQGVQEASFTYKEEEQADYDADVAATREAEAEAARVATDPTEILNAAQANTPLRQATLKFISSVGSNQTTDAEIAAVEKNWLNLSDDRLRDIINSGQREEVSRYAQQVIDSRAPVVDSMNLSGLSVEETPSNVQTDPYEAALIAYAGNNPETIERARATMQNANDAELENMANNTPIRRDMANAERARRARDAAVNDTPAFAAYADFMGTSIGQARSIWADRSDDAVTSASTAKHIPEQTRNAAIAELARREAARPATARPAPSIADAAGYDAAVAAYARDSLMSEEDVRQVWANRSESRIRGTSRDNPIIANMVEAELARRLAGRPITASTPTPTTQTALEAAAQAHAEAAGMPIERVRELMRSTPISSLLDRDRRERASPTLRTLAELVLAQREADYTTALEARAAAANNGSDAQGYREAWAEYNDAQVESRLTSQNDAIVAMARAAQIYRGIPSTSAAAETSGATTLLAQTTAAERDAAYDAAIALRSTQVGHSVDTVRNTWSNRSDEEVRGYLTGEGPDTRAMALAVQAYRAAGGVAGPTRRASSSSSSSSSSRSSNTDNPSQEGVRQVNSNFRARAEAAKESGALATLGKFWKTLMGKPGQRLLPPVDLSDLKDVVRNAVNNRGSIPQETLNTIKNRYNAALKAKAIEWGNANRQPVDEANWIDPITTLHPNGSGARAGFEGRFKGLNRGNGNPYIVLPSSRESSGSVDDQLHAMDAKGAGDLLYRLGAEIAALRGNNLPSSGMLMTVNSLRRQMQSASADTLFRPGVINPMEPGNRESGQGVHPDLWRGLTANEKIGVNAMRLAHSVTETRGRSGNRTSGRVFENLVFTSNGKIIAETPPKDVQGFAQGTEVTDAMLRAKVGETDPTTGSAIYAADSGGRGGIGADTARLAIMTNTALKYLEAGQALPRWFGRMAEGAGIEQSGWFFSEGDTETTTAKPITERQARARLADMLGLQQAKFLIDSGLVQFVDTLPHNAKGASSVKDGKILLALNKLTEETFDSVAIHEGLHSTIREILGDDLYNKFEAQLIDITKQGKGSDWMKDAEKAIPEDTPNARRPQELMAYAAENASKIPALKNWWKNFVAAIRAQLMASKFVPKSIREKLVMNMSDRDLAKLAIIGLKRGQFGGEKINPLVEASDFGLVEQSEPSKYIKALGKAKARGGNLDSVSMPTDDVLATSRVFLSDNGRAGFAITKKGDLIGVFNDSSIKGFLAEAVPLAIKNGAKTLDAYEGPLTEMYGEYGFVETKRDTWNDEYAPKNWNYEKNGTPDVVYMEYRAPKGDTLQAVHYSNVKRDKITGKHYGTGMKGAEARRLEGPENADIRERSHYYINGTKPESGVGGVAHNVTLKNMYDFIKDPDKLMIGKGLSLNDKERAVMAAGYNGYYTNTAAVVLGKHTVRPNKEGNKQGLQFHRAFHGSPYSLDKFDMGKVGTGTGDQHYGYGLYFAGKESIAEWYKNKDNTVGNMYEVELAPTEDEYLLWDKPLSEQSDLVRAALANRVMPESEGASIWENSAVADKFTGENIYNILKWENGKSAKATSEYLNSLGVRGVKFSDGGNDFNYVIFNDADVEITSRYSRDAYSESVINSKLPKGTMNGNEWLAAVEGTEFNTPRVTEMLTTLSDQPLQRDDLVRFNDGFRYSIAQEEATTAPPVAPAQPNEIVIVNNANRSGFRNLRESMLTEIQNKHTTLRRIQDIAGVRVSDTKSSVSGALDRHGSRLATRQQDLVTIPLDQISAILHNAGETRDNLDTLLKMRHAPWFNRNIAAINPLKKDAAGAYVSGYDLNDHAGSGIKTSVANEHTSDIDAKARSGDKKAMALKEAEAIYRKMIKDLQQYAVETGLETQETINVWNDTNPNYAPFNRELDLTENTSIGSAPGSSGTSVRAGVSRKAMGSSADIVSPLASTMLWGLKTTARGENAVVGRTFLEFAKGSDIKYVSKRGEKKPMWTVDKVKGTRVVKEVNVYLVNGTEFYSRDKANRHRDMLRAADPQGSYSVNLVPGGPQRRVVTQPAINKLNAKHTMIIPVDGENHIIQFDEQSPDAMAIYEGFTETSKSPAALVPFRAFSKLVMATSTGFNPVFSVFNSLFDIGGAMLSSNADNIPGWKASDNLNIAKNFMGAAINIGQHNRAVFDAAHTAGATIPDAPAGSMAEWTEKMKAAGGATGVSQSINDIVDAEAQIRRMFGQTALSKDEAVTWLDKGKTMFSEGGDKFYRLGEGESEGKVSGFLSREVVSRVARMNTASELATRAIVFKRATELYMADGKTEAEAMQLAAVVSKNLTVNFNRRGKLSSNINALYPFFNAAVQGTYRLGEVMFEKETIKKRDKHGNVVYDQGTKLSSFGKKFIGVLGAMGVAQAMLLLAAGIDDDEIDENIKNRAFIIPTGDGGYIAVPFLRGLNLPFNVARSATEMFQALARDDSKAAREHAYNATINQMMSFVPTGSAGNFLTDITPAAIDPLASLYMNKDAFGRPISREDINARTPTPGFTRAKEGATSTAKWLAEGINTMTFGNEEEQGLWSPTPEALEFAYTSVTGGVGREVSKTAKVVDRLYDKATDTPSEELPLHKVPLIGRLYGDTKSTGSQRSKLFDLEVESNVAHERWTGLKQRGETEAAEEYFKEHEAEIRLHSRLNRFVRNDAKARKQRAVARNDDDMARVNELTERQDAKVTKLLEDYDEMSQR